MRLFTSSFTTIALAAVLTLHPPTSEGAIVAPTDWITPGTGTIAGIGVSMTGLSSTFLAVHENQSFTTTNYVAGPLTNVDSLVYGANNDWSVTFATPLQDLYIYAASWRGTFITGSEPDTNYTFNLPFTILSGLAGSLVAGTTLTLPDNEFHYDGIIKFAGPITTLSVDSTGRNASGQVLTFATTVPEPTSFTLLAFGVSALAIARLRRTGAKPLNS